MTTAISCPRKDLPIAPRKDGKVLFTTWMGSFFDGFDSSIFVLTMFPSLSGLLNTHDHARIAATASFILCSFLLGWAAGSAIFGTLADKVGRVPTLVITILLYAGCTGLCALSRNWQELMFYRFLVGCGIGGEISVGGVLLAECWRGRPRYFATGLMTTAFSVGYFALAALNLSFPELGWRGLYLLGVIPSLLTVFVRLKLQESPEYAAAKKTESMISKSALLLQMFERQHLRNLLSVLLLASSTIVGYWAVLAWLPSWISALTGTAALGQRSTAAIVLNTGSIAGGLGLSLLFKKLDSKLAFAISFAGAFISCFCLFTLIKAYGTALLFCAFLAGAFTYAPFTALFIYVPTLFPVNQRATAFGISIQSARVLAAAATLGAGQIISACGGSYAIAGASFSFVYLVGLATSLFLQRSSKTL